MSLTPEQVERIERNRLAALERRANRQFNDNDKVVKKLFASECNSFSEIQNTTDRDETRGVKRAICTIDDDLDPDDLVEVGTSNIDNTIINNISIKNNNNITNKYSSEVEDISIDDDFADFEPVTNVTESKKDGQCELPLVHSKRVKYNTYAHASPSPSLPVSQPSVPSLPFSTSVSPRSSLAVSPSSISHSPSFSPSSSISVSPSSLSAPSTSPFVVPPPPTNTHIVSPSHFAPKNDPSKISPGKNANIVAMIKSMVPIAPDQIQKKKRNYSPLLSDEQCTIMDLALEGKSIFFSGSAGTGKSFLLREIVNELRKIKKADSIFVTATTGIAACNVGGITIHSFAGIGYGEETAAELASKVAKKQTSRRRWNKAKVLIIDEVSMLNGKLFDKIEQVARVVRKNDKPFGGLQLILCGDFFQLPPVMPKEQVNFCFEAKSWNKVITVSVELTRVFRQADPQFVSMLNEIRHGTVKPETISALKATSKNSLQIQSVGGHQILPTRLEPYRDDVSAENNRLLNDLKGEMHVYTAVDSGADVFLDVLKKNCPAPTILELKVGAQVILVKNLTFAKDLVNGARGVVIGFHKNNDEKQNEEKIAPVVKFASGAEMVIGPEEWVTEIGGKRVATRKQVPLTLAWCLSIHKSQGQTIEIVEMSLGSVFECGQAYVALSRAVSMSGLRVLSLDPTRIKAHPKVVDFYAKLAHISHLSNSSLSCPSTPSSSSSVPSSTSSTPSSSSTPSTPSSSIPSSPSTPSISTTSSTATSPTSPSFTSRFFSRTTPSNLSNSITSTSSRNSDPKDTDSSCNTNNNNTNNDTNNDNNNDINNETNNQNQTSGSPFTSKYFGRYTTAAKDQQNNIQNNQNNIQNNQNNIQNTQNNIQTKQNENNQNNIQNNQNHNGDLEVLDESYDDMFDEANLQPPPQ